MTYSIGWFSLANTFDCLLKGIILNEEVYF